MKYAEKKFDLSLRETIQLGGVRSCAMAAQSILNQNEDVPSNAVLVVYVLPGTGQKTWGNTFFLPNKDDADDLYAYLNGNTSWNGIYEKYAISEELLSLYRKGRINEFVEKRQVLLLSRETTFIESIVLNNENALHPSTAD